jgi:two-component system sensor kinase FixL
MPNLLDTASQTVTRESCEPETASTAGVIRHLAHELRQPLSAIESIVFYLDMILPASASNAREQLARLQDLVDQSDWIVSNALYFVQTSPPAPERVDVLELLTEASALCGDHAPQVEVDREHPLPAVLVDRAQAEHLMRSVFVFFVQAGAIGPVFFNTLMDDGSELVVIDASARVCICSQAKLDSLFEPFRPGLPAGLGLCMASSRRIAEAHGGWIRTVAGENRVTIQIALPPA